MMYETPKGEIEGPGSCANCGQVFTNSPKYHTMKVLRNGFEVNEAFCDAYCSLEWHEKQVKNHEISKEST